MRNWITLIEEFNAPALMDMWGLFDYFGVTEFKDKWYDLSVDWHNKNTISAIKTLLKEPKVILLSKIIFWSKIICKQDNWGSPFSTPEMFLSALDTPITLWKGGGEIYDPNGFKQKWTSFTASEKRAQTFSKYDGTKAKKVWVLPKREHYWIIKITIPLDSILLYFKHGDDEVIIPTALAKHSELILQT